jgi:hypothetical protein
MLDVLPLLLGYTARCCGGAAVLSAAEGNVEGFNDDT